MQGVSYSAFAATAVLAAAALAVAAWRWRRPDPPPPMRARFTLELPESVTVAPNSGQESVAISPDGSEFVYPGAGPSGPALYRRRLNDLTSTTFVGSFANPRYSPDGRWLLLEADGTKLKKIPINGGAPLQVADSGIRPSWGDGGLVVFSHGGSLWRVSATGGNPTQLTTLDPARETSHTWPSVLPGGEEVLFNIIQARSGSVDNAEVAVVRVRDGRITRLGVTGTNPRYLPSGHLLVSHQDGTVLGVPFDLRSLTVRGEPSPVLENVFVKSGGAALYAVSNTGVLAYVRGEGDSRPVWIDQSFHEHPSGLPAGRYSHLRLAPTGDRLAFVLREGGASDIWIFAKATGQVIRVTRDGRSDMPEWSADGDRIGWTHAGFAEIVWQRADGTGALDTMRLGTLRPSQFTVAPNGKFLIVAASSANGADLLFVPLDSSVRRRVIVEGRLRPGQFSISPDSKWLAFIANETGRAEVYVTSIEDPATRLEVSNDNGAEALWLADGKRLLYRGFTHLTEVTLSFAPRLEVTRRDTLPLPQFMPANTADRWFDVDHKTGELVVLHRGAAHDRVIVVTDWFDELRERLARGGKP
jgi:Tol biopolymer transport system component